METSYIAGKKTTALSFVVMVLVANFWFIRRFTGEEFPDWSTLLFFGGVFGVVLGFLMMLPVWCNPLKTKDSTDEDS